MVCLKVTKIETNTNSICWLGDTGRTGGEEKILSFLQFLGKVVSNSILVTVTTSNIACLEILNIRQYFYNAFEAF
jgi:hypothetical protein